jgi:hypothetical protein
MFREKIAKIYIVQFCRVKISDHSLMQQLHKHNSVHGRTEQINLVGLSNLRFLHINSIVGIASAAQCAISLHIFERVER